MSPCLVTVCIQAGPAELTHHSEGTFLHELYNEMFLAYYNTTPMCSATLHGYMCPSSTAYGEYTYHVRSGICKRLTDALH